jgi:hypothetical protein
MFINPIRALLCALALVVAPVSGTLAANEPVPGIEVSIRTQANSMVIIQVTTSAKGEFDVKRLPAGKYTMQLGGKNIEAARAAGGRWTIALLPVTREHTSLPPQVYDVSADGKGVLQVELVVPDGQAVSYAGTLTR